MWLMNFLPNWIFHAILLSGVLGLIASLVLKFIPFFATYRLPIQVGSILLIVVGVWFEGAISNQASWEARVKEVEAQVAAAEAKSAQANVKIVTKVVKQLELVRTRGDDIIRYVDREVAADKEVIKFVENCPIPKIVIDTHNAAAANKPVVGETK
jgi:hypothetical protein